MIGQFWHNLPTMVSMLLRNLAVNPEPFALCHLDSGWRVLLPAQPGVVFHFVLKGKGSVRDPNGRCTEVAPNSAIIIPSCSRHSLETKGEVGHELQIDKPPEGTGICQIVAGSNVEHDMIVACGRINARYGDAVGLFDHLRSLLIVDMSGVSNVESLFDEILDEQAKNAPGCEVIVASLMMQVIVYMFRLLETESNGSLPWLSALQDERLARAIDSIFENPGANHSVESLAADAGMSRSAFAEHFSTAFSRSPINFVNHVRMEHAGRMLYDGAFSIDQIANRVGFSSRSHFSQLFKKHTGQSPTDYRVKV
jgi:AraC family transcriptional activator of mtrCDE